MERILVAIGFGLTWTVLGVGLIWAALVLFHLPRLTRVARIVLSIAFPAALVGVIYWLGGSWTAAGIVGVAVLCLAVAWTFYRAEHRITDATKEPPMPRVEFAGDTFTIRNYGGFALEDGKAKFDYYDRTFDLRKLESVWFGVQPFKGFTALGHTYAAFDFGDDDVLGVSVQSRRPDGTPFDVLAGLFKTYGLIYYLCDERHAVGYESLCSGARLYRYRMRADGETARRVLTGVLERAERLAEHPEFYHSLVNNCTSNLVCEANRVLTAKISIYSPRIVMTGFSDSVAYAHGLIDAGDLSLAEVRAKADVTDLACQARDETDFSRRLGDAWNREPHEPHESKASTLEATADA